MSMIFNGRHHPWTIPFDTSGKDAREVVVVQRIDFFGPLLGALGLLSACAAPIEGGLESGGAGGSGGQGGGGTVADAAGGDTPSSDGSDGSGGGAIGSPACGPAQHLCGGICTDLPASGCYADPTCTPCPVPENGTATCTADGSCDFECGAGYNKTGGCASQCCSPADCEGGAACDNGVCVPPPEPCDSIVCITTCLFEGKIGVCVADACVCQ
jgi:hypothetical protein